MRPALAVLALVAVLAPGAAVAAPANLAAAPAPPGLSVALDKTVVSTAIGQRFSFTSTVRNDGDRPAPAVIAHLNVLSLDPDTYVDPEDWSSSRTAYAGTLAPHATARLAWNVQAVNTGRFVLYVAVTAEQGAAHVTGSDTLRLAVAEQRTLDAGGMLPLAAAMPAGVLLLIGLVARSRRRLR
jgi:hypothetical protein